MAHHYVSSCNLLTCQRCDCCCLQDVAAVMILSMFYLCSTYVYPCGGLACATSAACAAISDNMQPSLPLLPRFCWRSYICCVMHHTDSCNAFFPAPLRSAAAVFVTIVTVAAVPAGSRATAAADSCNESYLAPWKVQLPPLPPLALLPLLHTLLPLLASLPLLLPPLPQLALVLLPLQLLLLLLLPLLPLSALLLLLLLLPLQPFATVATVVAANRLLVAAEFGMLLMHLGNPLLLMSARESSRIFVAERAGISRSGPRMQAAAEQAPTQIYMPDRIETEHAKSDVLGCE